MSFLRTDLQEPEIGAYADVDPAFIPEDFHSINLDEAVRLTPATLAYHITQGAWIPAPHLLYISSIIAREILEGNSHIIVSLPPRHGKSELISVHTPIWHLDLFPEDPIILATYGADLSATFTRRVRDSIIELGGEDNKPSPAHILAGRPRLRTTIRSDLQQATNFQTPQGGGMVGVGVGGPITGKGAKLLLVDDYIKNAEDAASKTSQQAKYDWFTSTAYTRLEPGGSVVILATRWDVNDLIGMLIANQDDFEVPWTIIEIPAIAYNDGTPCPLGRRPGDALWPARYPLARLRQIRSLLGPYYWSAEYQQRPIKRTDVKFDAGLIEIITDIPHRHKLRTIRSWDLAGTESKRADWTVGTLLGQDGPPKATMTNTIIMDRIRGRWEQAKLEEVMLETAENDGPDVPIIIEQEPGSSGKNYGAYLRDTVLRGYSVEIVAPQSDKWLKAQPYFAAVARGRVKMLAASWNQEMLDEFEAFPSGTYDDQVDSVSQGFNKLFNRKLGGAVWGRGGSSYEQTPTGLLVPKKQGIITGATFGRNWNG